jgi:hypothetical protein
VARKPPVTAAAVGDAMTTRVAGAYADVLRSVVEEEVSRREDGAVLLASTAAECAAYEQRHAELLVEVTAEHAGKPLRCRSYHLPARLPAPYDRWPKDQDRSFIVYPNDEIVLQPKRSERNVVEQHR